MQEEMEFTRPRLEALKKRYQEAVESKAENFTFDGHLILTDYAKYMIEYLEGVLNEFTTREKNQ
jgi:hypothetical protein